MVAIPEHGTGLTINDGQGEFTGHAYLLDATFNKARRKRKQGWHS
jgi:hypothetical protein